MKKKRAPSPRFKPPKTLPTVEISDDDEQIILAVYRYRVIDANMIQTLLPGRSEQGLSRRLNLLRKAKYLDRPEQQATRERRDSGGSAPLVYALGREGARLLRDRGISINTSYWTQKNRELRSFSIQHTLETTGFMVKIELASRAHEHVSVIHLDEILGAEKRDLGRRKSLPTNLSSPINWNGHRLSAGTAADKIFGLHDTSQPNERAYRYFFLEIDRGTETITPGARRITSPSFFRDTSLLRKFIVYASAFRARSHVEQFGIPTFRVLTITTNPARVAEMQKCFQMHLTGKEMSVNPGFLLFTDWETIRGTSGSLFDAPIQNAAGKTASLIG